MVSFLRTILILYVSSTSAQIADSFDDPVNACETIEGTLESLVNQAVSELVDEAILDEVTLVDPQEINYDGWLIDMNAKFSGLTLKPGSFSVDLDLDVDCELLTVGGSGAIATSNTMIDGQLNVTLSLVIITQEFTQNVEFGFETISFELEEVRAGIGILPPSVDSTCVTIGGVELKGFYITSPIPEVIETEIEDYLQAAIDMNPFSEPLIQALHGVLDRQGALCK